MSRGCTESKRTAILGLIIAEGRREGKTKKKKEGRGGTNQPI